MLINSLEYYFDDLLEIFINANNSSHGGVYSKKRDEDYVFAFLEEVKKVFKDPDNYKTFFSLPEDYADVVRQYLGVYTDFESFNWAEVARRKGITSYQAQKMELHLCNAIRNELFKRLYNRCYGSIFEEEEIGKEKSIGIHVLELSPIHYTNLRRLRYNTLEDIVSTNSEVFRILCKSISFFEIVEKLHLMSYRFKDELDIPMEELIARDIESKKERLGKQKEKALRCLENIREEERQIKNY